MNEFPLPCTCRHRKSIHNGPAGRCNYAAGCYCDGYRAARATSLFERNALSYLTSHGIRDVWAGWLIARGHLSDMDQSRPLREGDVLDEETLNLLPAPWKVRLEPRESPVMGVEAI